ncbi:nuclease-like protein [Rhodopseudomonas thermotolerans]|uniref:Nuclease-like protein n=2 Tax=Rhodopseudomonas TaxID=1073 RepID=A0A336JM74_9BRAD|nr:MULTISPECIES: thermonuclease family protein [Rhodopseudomonas]RED36220.1 nuclease-like protein [Rhodopseudomonas pentothenatexigens]REG03593.1 nuclease-like protein [Rhodopseudomonas thermotolerans]SSW90780.1 nuclease-like protein [Rhodopseudomonas pentothenatexigens]
MRRLIVTVLGLVMMVSPALAAEAVVKDGDTLQLGDKTFRLEGIDAPELDQRCVSQFADPSACGLEARDALVRLIGGRSVTCRDLGPDPVFKGRRLGTCAIAGDTESLSRRLVQDGFALNAASGGKDRFAGDETRARDERKGLWQGCFVAPIDFRRWDKAATLRGAACRDDKHAELVEVMFPDTPAMLQGCTIKGKLAKRARITGNVGVYQIRGCPSYASLTKPNRWFCSEDDARAAGFRKAYNCRIKAAP